MSDEAAFHRFLSEFRTLSSTLSSQLSSVPNQATIQAQRESLQQAELTSDELSQLISNIESDLRHYPYTIRTKSQQQLVECQQQFDQQQDIVTKYRTSLRQNKQLQPDQNARAALLGDRMNGVQSEAYNDQRAMLLDNRELLHEGDSSLDNTTRMIAEATEIGAVTTDKLVQQREQFIGQRDMLDETDTFLHRSSKTLRRMSNRLITNKLLSLVIIIILIGLFVLIAWIKYLK